MDETNYRKLQYSQALAKCYLFEVKKQRRVP